MERAQATVVYWVATRTLFDVCAQEIGFKGVGGLMVPWCRQNAVEDQLRFMVEAVLSAERVWLRQESGRRDGSEGGLEGWSTNIEE